MADLSDHRSAQPFLSHAEEAQFDLLGDLLAGDLVERPEGSAPLDLPDEWMDYQLAKHMGWSSDELDACPVWRKQRWTAFMVAERRAAQQGSSSRARGPLPSQTPAQRQSVQDRLAEVRARVPGWTPPPDEPD